MMNTRLKRSRNFHNLNLEEETSVDEYKTREISFHEEEEHQVEVCELKVTGGGGGGSDMTIEDAKGKLAILRELLNAERLKNDRRKENGASMRRYVRQIQDDYLTLQRELLEVLESAHKMKAQKEAQLDTLNETLKEREDLMNHLKSQLESLEPEKLRENFNELLRKQDERAQMEREQLVNQMSSMEQQLVRERVSNSQTLQQFQEHLDKESKRHESETIKLKEQITELESELSKTLEEPKNLLVKTLKDERAQLEFQVEELNQAVSESQKRHEALRKRAENLVQEQEVLEKSNQSEVERLNQEIAQQRAAQQDLKLSVRDKEELIQVLQFNVQRSEKRSNCLLRSIRCKELAYKEALGQLEIKHEQVVREANAKNQNLERRLVDVQNELDQRQNELVRTRLEQEAQLDALRNDRDERLNRLNQEKQRAEKNHQSSELKLARELELKEQNSRYLEELQKELDQFRDEAKRLSMELAKSEAKIFSKQHELNQVIAEQRVDKFELEERQKLMFDLEDTKRHSSRLQRLVEQLKSENESLRAKLRLSDANLSKVSSAIKKEHTKLVLEYEEKLEQIRQEQVVYDRNKIRYKRYGFKLKKYCEHLSKVHEHICNPTTCGYSVVYIKQSQELKQQLDKSPFSSDNEDDQTEKRIPQEHDVNHQNRKENLTPVSFRSHRRRHDKFSIKRTGTSPFINNNNNNNNNNSSANSSVKSTKGKSILKIRNQNQMTEPTFHHQTSETSYLEEEENLFRKGSPINKYNVYRAMI